ncbi:MAG: DNA polymerase III subunit gamma/tau [Rubrivivax sp.]|nr:DNA polymerase III subunit gamma/tau [Rubrivivax sp.]
MSTVVLARKYRPRNFAQMVGQEHVVTALTHALTQNRLHHAYLFTGTRGIGKTTVSRILAKSLNCTGPDGQGGITATPCGECQACREIDADRYIDYIELDAASNRSIDEIRDLIERAAYKPGIGRFKVFMIDEAHQLTKDAFNALLKTLEEPPEYLKFVLATTDPEKMLPTVLSRCLQFNLRPMAPDTVRAHLAQVLAAEGVAHDEASLKLLGRAARGSMRDGLSLTDQAIAYGGGKLEEGVVRTMLGSVERGRARELVAALAARDGAAVLALVDGLRQRGQSAIGTLDELATLLQQAAVEQVAPGTLEAGDAEADEARAVAPLLAPDETQLLYSMALHGRAELALMPDEHSALSMVLLRFLAFPSEAAAARDARSAPLRAPAPPTSRSPVATSRPPTTTAGHTNGVAATGVRPADPEVPNRPDAAGATRTHNGPPGHETGDMRATPVEPRPRSSASLPVVAAEPAPSATGVPRALGDRWCAIVSSLIERGSISALVRELAWSSALVALDEGSTPPTWRLVVERETLRQTVLADRLAAAMAAVVEGGANLELVAGTPEDSPARRDAAERARRQAEAEATIQGDPVVRELLATYKGARIVPGSIKPI